MIDSTASLVQFASGLALFAVAVTTTACDEPEVTAPEQHELRRSTLTNGVEPLAISVPTEAVCSINVRHHGVRAMETDYLPNVLACEAPGNATLAMLEAQAIAARSYAYYFAETEGQICNGQGCQVFSCGRSPSALHRQAVENTSGVVLRYNENLTIGFYVAGDSSPNANCVGNSAGVSNTERWVTYNEGNAGHDVEQSRIGFRHSTSATDYGQNRGALSQWGAHCLATKFDYDSIDILRYFYGEDIEFEQVQGSCVEDIDFDTDAGPAECTTIAPNGDTILDNDSDCMRLLGPAQYWRTASTGIGGSLRWTRSTRSAEHNVAVWTLNPEVAGEYRLQAHIDPSLPSAPAAKYELVSVDAAETVTIDQTLGGWVDLGIVRLTPETAGQQVRMTDAIGVSGETLQADALRVTPVTAGSCEDGDCPADGLGPSTAAPTQTGGGCRITDRNPGNLYLGALLGLGVLGARRRRRT